ncbi:MAG: protease modulator HflK [Planctomycetes bacterium]|nr:protease modulator HflK [Planctomycetota bacterium]
MRRLLIGLLVLLLVGYLFTGVTQIRPGERAVVRRFGRVLDTLPAPGLWIGLPWGMDRVDRVPVHMVRRLEVGFQPEAEDAGQTMPPGQLLTGDHNLVNARVAVHYAVLPRDEEIVQYVLNQDRIDSVVSRAVEAVMVEWAAGRRIDDILIHGKTELPGILVQGTQERLRPYHLGVQVLQVSVAQLLPPDEVKPAFDDVTRAQANIRTREEEALRQAGQRLGEAQRDQYAKEQQALAYADEQRRLARAEAVSFGKRLQEYQRLRQENPQILTAIWWDEMARVFAGMKENGRLDLLDNRLGGDGLDISEMPPLPRKR